MAKSTGLGQLFMFDGYDLSGDVGSVDTVSTPRGTLDVTAINTSAVERLHGTTDGEISFTSFFNDAAGQSWTLQQAIDRTDRLVLYAMSSSIDAPCAMLSSKQTSYDPTRGADGSLTFTTQCLSNGFPLEWGVMLSAGIDTIGSAGTVASKDDSASSSAGASAMLQIDSVGSGSPTFLIEDSPNDSDWSTLITFTTSSTPTAERKTVTGTVNRYLRVSTAGSTHGATNYAIGYRRGTANDIAGIIT